MAWKNKNQISENIVMLFKKYWVSNPNRIAEITGLDKLVNTEVHFT
jgi:hypothetical protein